MKMYVTYISTVHCTDCCESLDWKWCTKEIKLWNIESWLIYDKYTDLVHCIKLIDCYESLERLFRKPGRHLVNAPRPVDLMRPSSSPRSRVRRLATAASFGCVRDSSVVSRVCWFCARWLEGVVYIVLPDGHVQYTSAPPAPPRLGTKPADLPSSLSIRYFLYHTYCAVSSDGGWRDLSFEKWDRYM